MCWKILKFPDHILCEINNVLSCLLLYKSPQNGSRSFMTLTAPHTVKEPQNFAEFSWLIHHRAMLTINFSRIDYPMLLIWNSLLLFITFLLSCARDGGVLFASYNLIFKSPLWRLLKRFFPFHRGWQVLQSDDLSRTSVQIEYRSLDSKDFVQTGMVQISLYRIILL